MRTRPVASVALVVIAIATCLFLGTVGWLAVGFSVMTDCTNNYSCSTTSCAPCATSGRWINVGAVVQLALAAVGVVVLLRRVRRRLAIIGAGLLALSVLTVVGTTLLAQESYCRPGAPGFQDSYCGVDA